MASAETLLGATCFPVRLAAIDVRTKYFRCARPELVGGRAFHVRAFAQLSTTQVCVIVGASPMRTLNTQGVAFQGTAFRACVCTAIRDWLATLIFI